MNLCKYQRGVEDFYIEGVNRELKIKVSFVEGNGMMNEEIERNQEERW